MKKLRKYITAAACVLASLIFFWLAGFGVFLGYVAMEKPQEPSGHTDALIVPTGGSNRIHTGLDLLSGGMSGHLLISGVGREVSLEDIRKIWRPGEKALPCCITLGHDALNTKGNAEEVKNWMEQNHYHSLRLVTSNYHMPRTLIEFRRAMPEMTMILHPVKSVSKINFIQVAFGEYNKTLLTLVRGVFSGGTAA